MTQQAAEIESKKLVQTILNDVGDIVTMPEVTVRIIDIVEDPKSKMQDLHNVIRNDPALSSRILRVVNSALYGLPGQVASIDRAIVLLGLSAVKNIAIATSMTHMFTGESSVEGFSGKDVWNHSIAMAVAAKLAYAIRKRPGGDEAFLTGLIADLGLLIERQAVMEPMAAAIEQFRADGGSFIETERQFVGTDHCALGMALAQKWRFPEPVCQSIGYHHFPEKLPASQRELPGTILVADFAASRHEAGFCTYPVDAAPPEAVLAELKMTMAQFDELLEQMQDQVAAANRIFES